MSAGTNEGECVNFRNGVRMVLMEGGEWSRHEMQQELGCSTERANTWLKWLAERGEAVMVRRGRVFVYRATPSCELEPWRGIYAVRRWVVSASGLFQAQDLADGVGLDQRQARRFLYQLIGEGLIVALDPVSNKDKLTYQKTSERVMVA